MKSANDNMKPSTYFIFYFFVTLKVQESSSLLVSPNKPRIIGGTVVNSSEAFPYTVALIHENGQYFCSGAIVDKRVVLTAAHCMQEVGSQDGIYAIVGTSNIVNYDPSYQRIRSQNWTMHENYTQSIHYDVAVIKLQAPIIFNKYTSILPLYSTDLIPLDGYNVTVCGWGYYEVSTSSSVLRYPNFICATGVNNSRTCAGDSGSSLVFQTRRGTYVGTGVLSFGPSNCSPAPVVFTRVSKFHQMASNNKNGRFVSKIGTHNGVFHCDEALACFMLKLLPDYADADIIRSRDDAVLDSCDIVVDVGGVYNPKQKRFDHHQRDFVESLSSIRPDLAKNRNIKLSSAGLIYAHYGMEVLSELLLKNKINVASASLPDIYLHVYDGFIQEIDAIDNGLPICNEGHPVYQINTSISARVQKLNPAWNSKSVQSPDDLFQKAMEYVGAEFTAIVVEASTIWWQARAIVLKALLDRNKIYKTGEIIELEERCPWAEHLFSLEEDLNIVGHTKFVLFLDRDKSCRVQSVPITPGSFLCRNFLHDDWRGLRDVELSKISGIDGSIFCHHTGFIGGNKSRDGALQMAIKSLNS
ncbi:hypothetical protein FQR65_LT02007 [Abscondita terminalis]|nr:hypothetical protein FQR65_LT02007 [Abscondita terminalis]